MENKLDYVAIGKRIRTARKRRKWSIDIRRIRIQIRGRTEIYVRLMKVLLEQLGTRIVGIVNSKHLIQVARW